MKGDSLGRLVKSFVFYRFPSSVSLLPRRKRLRGVGRGRRARERERGERGERGGRAVKKMGRQEKKGVNTRKMLEKQGEERRGKTEKQRKYELKTPVTETSSQFLQLSTEPPFLPLFRICTRTPLLTNIPIRTSQPSLHVTPFRLIVPVLLPTFWKRADLTQG